MRRLTTFLLMIPLLGAVAASAVAQAPTTTEELLSGMVTEEVEPGVFRVINDGVRDLSLGRSVFYAGIVAGHDGSVWVWAEGPDGALRLGHEATDPGTLGDWIDEADFEPYPSTVVGPDGTVWYRHWHDGYLYRFGGEAWTLDRPDTRVDALALGPDGRLWAAWQGKHVGRRVDGTWETVTDAPDGYALTLPGESDYEVGGGMAVTDDGDIWLWSRHTWLGMENISTKMHHFDGRTWRSLDLPGGDDGRAAVGQDGTVWWVPSDEGEAFTAIHRFDGDEWQRFDAADDWPDGMGRLEVAPDGRLWVFPFNGPGGAYLFDGDVWTPYLDDVDIPPRPDWRLDGFVVGLAGDIAPDGSAWVLAADARSGSDEEVGLYVITPEAVAANEAEVSEPPPVEEVTDNEEATTTTADLLTGMVTEEVEPGVYRVTGDGVRDLRSVEAVDIVAGYDDGIWLLREDEFRRLGSDDPHRWPMGSGPEDHIFEVAPDGTMWVIPRGWDGHPHADAREEAGLRSTGEEWALQSCPGGYCYGLTVAPDGMVWATYYDEDGKWVGRLGPTGWEPLHEAGSVEADRLFPTEAGDLYGVEYIIGPKLLRYEDGAWERLCTGCAYTFDAGRDGSLWANRGSDGIHKLARFADGEWAEWTSADLLPDIASILGFDDQFRVAPDGSLWSSLWLAEDVEPPEDDDWGDLDTLNGHGVCDGLVRFDRQTLDRFLPGRCVSMDIAADGSVWVLAAEEMVWVPGEGWLEEMGLVLANDATWDLYVITPEAVAAAE